MGYHDLLAVLAVLLTFAAYGPYIASVHKGQTRPHVVSWVIWGAGTVIVFAAQVEGGGGAGAWPIGLSGLITLYIAFLAFMRRSAVRITRLDLVFMGLAGAALPFWLATDNPLTAVILLTTADLMGFGPTFAKAYRKPREEQLLFYVLMAARNGLALLALETVTLTTALFPAAVGLACVCFVFMVVWRRHMIPAA